jgi:hypothetical protein
MDKVSALLHRAAEVRRTIFASLPWGVRFAHIWGQLVAGDEALFDAWGKALGAIFLQAGVPEMPDPGPGWEKHPGDARRLPHGYMADFMAEVYRTILGQSARDPSVPEEAISSFFNKLQTGKAKIDLTKLTEGFKSAKTWAYTGMVNEGKTIRKKKVREFSRQEDVREDEEGREAPADLIDPRALDEFRKLERNPRMWKEWMDYLAQHLHPDMPLYLNLRMEGYTNDQIVGNLAKNEPGMLPTYKAHGHPMKSDPTLWGDKIFRKVPETTNQFLHAKGLKFEDLYAP